MVPAETLLRLTKPGDSPDAIFRALDDNLNDNNPAGCLAACDAAMKAGNWRRAADYLIDAWDGSESTDAAVSRKEVEKTVAIVQAGMKQELDRLMAARHTPQEDLLNLWLVASGMKKLEDWGVLPGNEGTKVLEELKGASWNGMTLREVAEAKFKL